jgi:4-hydroxy-2-oxoheptanedioate aldolase
MILKEKMKKGPVFGMAVFTGAVCEIESLGAWGFDFAYLDIEHTALGVGPEIEKQIMAAKLAGISPIIRLAGTDEVAIRKALEMGAEGVIIPHIRTKEEAEHCVRAAKFPPMGRRGAESNVRAAGFGGPGFSWSDYIAKTNAETMVIPMMEDFEFDENIDEILSVPGVDAVNFGPIDFSLSIGEPIAYKMGDSVNRAFARLVERARKKGIGVLGPCIPPTIENTKKLIAEGYNMLIMGNDMWHFHQACKSMMTDCIPKIREQL